MSDEAKVYEGGELTERLLIEALKDHTKALILHSKSLCAHCQCLAYNAENMWAAILNESPKYYQSDYNLLLYSWGLIDKEGKPKI